MRPVKPTTGTIALQDRDLALLRSLFECRVMTNGHVAALHFGGGKETAKKRLQKLKAAGLIGERSRRAFESAVLFLTKKGFASLNERGVLSDYPEFDLPALERRAFVSPITLAHELEVMDVKAAFHLAAGKSESAAVTVAEFSTWPLLNEFKTFRPDGSEMLVRPDGFIRLHEKEAGNGLSEHAFFLEVDRSTETQGTLAVKAACYLHFYKSGGFAERNGAPRSASKDYPFRVLMTFKTAERRNNMAERLLQNNPPIFTQVYLSTLPDVVSDPFGAVWIRPIDYRDATAGKQGGMSTVGRQRAYQRQTARDLLVEQTVKKSRLLD